MGNDTVTIATMITSFSTVMTSLVGIITGNTVLYTLLAGSLVATAAGVFKRIKNAVK